MIEEAVNTLKKDELIAYPTETVYGVGANALKKPTIEKVFKIKKRSKNKPISLAISSWEMFHEIAEIDKKQLKTLKELMPGPVTAIVKKTDKVPNTLTAGSDKVGVRFPDNKTAIKIIKQFGSPITSTSANITGEKPPKNHKQIKIPVDYIVEAGTTEIGTSSTIIEINKNIKILREGPITKKQIQKIQKK
ncbi:tRNA A37 threonylcarbamoyladenosine synthetase subunit TsaC/SUA5/YrdC [Methanonatronarchaeum thermophilum]|uniref:L-threonylcarbamoyladenylate synthase n=1 Tax=Methanonatronarchaeum thermophilum TaxID=1927129 RepID=A0A1Y3GGL2_9EURY|nr:L-threonylcarbamoyladenylate synthase [Methanonatronarchaeum thermophilum]OUJ18575.1 tRNA A37 threonylcarbamoyladenosine synthetase subunit TsaC/SUA5/YrdC [Methanonatronarchaeum thermophilum]